MRLSGFGLTALAMVAGDTACAFDDTLLRGYSEVVRGEGYLAMPVGTIDRPMSKKRDTKAFEDRLFNEQFFYATQGKAPMAH